MSFSKISKFLLYSLIESTGVDPFTDRFYEFSRGALTREGLGLKVMAATCAATLGSYVDDPATTARFDRY